LRHSQSWLGSDVSVIDICRLADDAGWLEDLPIAPGPSARHYEGSAVQEEQFMAYSDKVVDHYNNPRNVGSLPKEDPNVGTGLVGAPECGDVMKLQMRINPETQVIEEARFKTFGCGSAIASSSLATEWVKGKTVEEALSIKNTDIVRELALPPVKIHCSVLAEDAIKAAIGNWKNKHNLPVAEAEKASH
jgi:nitrogen fixation NifU-like protein